MKAKYIGKYRGTRYNRHMIYLEYEYKGYTYTVYENTAKGNEPLSWQHKAEQARIDKIIKEEEKQKQCTKEEIEKAQKELENAINLLFMTWEE